MPLGSLQSDFTQRYRHTPAVRAFLAEDNLRAAHGRLDAQLRATHRAYGREAPALVLDETFEEEVEAFARRVIHAPRMQLDELNAAFVRQYTEPLAAQLYHQSQFQSRIDDAREAGRPERFRRQYSQRVVDLPELVPTARQYPALTALPRQTAARPPALAVPRWRREGAPQSRDYLDPRARG